MTILNINEIKTVVGGRSCCPNPKCKGKKICTMECHPCKNQKNMMKKSIKKLT